MQLTANHMSSNPFENTSFTGEYRLPKSGNQPQNLVLLIHGYGANGANLINLADYFQPSLADALFIAPNGIESYELAPDQDAYQWFSLLDRQTNVMLAGVRKAADAINPFIDHQLAQYDIARQNVILIGFSQGTMTSLHIAMRRKPKIKAVVGFSGALLAAETLPQEIVSRPPTLLIHGEDDEIVPFVSMALAQRALRNNGVQVATKAISGLDHSIDINGVKHTQEFLLTVNN